MTSILIFNQVIIPKRQKEKTTDSLFLTFYLTVFTSRFLLLLHIFKNLSILVYSNHLFTNLSPQYVII